MKQRPPKRPKQFRRPTKRLPPTSTLPSEWLTPLAEPTRWRAGSPGTSGIVQPPLPLRDPADQAAFTMSVQGGATKSVIERRLTEQPAAIRDTARALSKEFKSQASELKRQRPNDPDRTAQRDNLVVLSENIANGFAHLADDLDQAITKGSKDKPEPVFLGKAADVAHGLHLRLMEWLEENRTTLFEVPFKVGIFVTGVIFLHSVGADSTAAIAALGVLVKSTATKKDKTKRQRK